MKAIPFIAVLLLASATAAQTAYELPRPTTLTVTNGLVECADAAGCVVQRACGAPTTPFADSDFAQVGIPLAEGETLETPRVNSRVQTCAVRVIRDDGTQAAASANVTGLRYVKLRQANDSFHVVGVAETAVHRTRTVASVVRPVPMVSASGGNLLAYLFDRYDFDMGSFAREFRGEECDHIRRDRPEYEECVRGDIEDDAMDMIDVPDTPYTRCIVDLLEMQCSGAFAAFADDYGLCPHGDNTMWNLLDAYGPGVFEMDIIRSESASLTMRILRPHCMRNTTSAERWRKTLSQS